MITTRLSEMQIGEELKQKEIGPVTRLDLIKYAGSSGDYNPIHTIDEEATKAGLPGIIAHGMWTMGNLSSVCTPYLGEGFIRTYNIRFSGMVFLNDRITLKAQLKEKEQDTLVFQVAAVNQHDKKVLKGSITFQLY